MFRAFVIVMSPVMKIFDLGKIFFSGKPIKKRDPVRQDGKK
jgi:hypothetical protein